MNGILTQNVLVEGSKRNMQKIHSPDRNALSFIEAAKKNLFNAEFLEPKHQRYISSHRMRRYKITRKVLTAYLKLFTLKRKNTRTHTCIQNTHPATFYHLFPNWRLSWFSRDNSNAERIKTKWSVAVIAI